MKVLPQFQGTFLSQLNTFVLETGIVIKFTPLQCDIPPADVDASETFLECLENDSLYQLDGFSHNYFTAKVTVKYKGLKGTDYLGCCSYSSYDNFKEQSGYYFDMINMCIDEINAQIVAKMPKVIKKKVNKGIDRIFKKVFTYYECSGDICPSNMETLEDIKKTLNAVLLYETKLNFEASKN